MSHGEPEVLWGVDKSGWERNALPLVGCTEGGTSASGQEAKGAAVQGHFSVEKPLGIFLES